MTDTVLVVAKAPIEGRSKTRLVPPLSPAQAARLHTALLRDTVVSCRQECPDVRFLHASPDDEPGLEAVAPDVPRVLQRGRGLADALRYGLADHVADGPCAAVSSDVPGLPAGSLRRAFAALAAGADVVLGPAADGGYWLIALREPQAAPFRDIPWSTPAVFGVTLARCREAGLAVAELERWRDVDTLVDLAALAAQGGTEVGPHTAALLGELDGVVPAPLDVALSSSELLHGSPWRTVLRDRIVSGSRETEYTYLSASRAVFVAAVTPRAELLLVRQYRHPVRDWTLEVPAGSVAEHESPLAAARRELREETGAHGGSWTHLSTFFSSSAHLSMRSDAFLATDVGPGLPSLDGDEALTAVRMPVAEAVARARAGGFAEGQTALTILLAAERLGLDRT
ncbi:MAG: TIGR04282 family arsenosugar biosynthesis glycosyltransferase [Gaiella sp.]